MAGHVTGRASRLAPVTPDEAVSGIRSGDRVYIGTGAAEPDSLVEALTARAGALRDVRIIQALTFGPARYVAPEHARSFRVTTFFIAPNVREAVAEGRADFVPVFLHETGRLCENVDWALVQLSPPDRHGFCSTGVSGGHHRAGPPVGPARGGRDQPADAAHARRHPDPRRPARPPSPRSTGRCPRWRRPP